MTNPNSFYSLHDILDHCIFVVMWIVIPVDTRQHVS